MCKIYIILSLYKPNPKAESIERVQPAYYPLQPLHLSNHYILHVIILLLYYLNFILDIILYNN